MVFSMFSRIVHVLAVVESAFCVRNRVRWLYSRIATIALFLQCSCESPSSECAVICGTKCVKVECECLYFCFTFLLRSMCCAYLASVDSFS